MVVKRKNEIESLIKSGQYKDIAFDQRTGGFKATHIEHNFDPIKGWYETVVQNAGFRHGHEVILEKEDHTILNKRNIEGTWDGMYFEIAAAENGTPNNIKNALKHCAKKIKTEIAVIFFPNGYDKSDFVKGLYKFKGLEKLNDEQYKKFNIIYLINKNGDLTKIKP